MLSVSRSCNLLKPGPWLKWATPLVLFKQGVISRLLGVETKWENEGGRKEEEEVERWKKERQRRRHQRGLGATSAEHRKARRCQRPAPAPSTLVRGHEILQAASASQTLSFGEYFEIFFYFLSTVVS